MYEQNISQYHPQPSQRRLNEQEDDTLEPEPANDWLIREAASVDSMIIPRSTPTSLETPFFSY